MMNKRLNSQEGVMLNASQATNDFEASLASLFSATPIVPLREAAAYESLWLGDGAWFKKIADLFRENPDALPSELVPPETIDETLQLLTERVGRSRLDQVGIRVYGSGEYPEKLRAADHPVEMLYYLGNWELVDTPAVAVVGTRNPSTEGEDNTRRIVKSLVNHGITVVSGLAKGVDTIAHTSALDAGGKTIAVIGTPLFESYPKENAELQNIIAKQWLLISQVPFLRYSRQTYKHNSFFFPARNVTMSALTQATVIVEAGNTSGTLVQARAALAQKRKLFILESCFRNKDLTWPAKFEKEGAIRVRKIRDIVNALDIPRNPD
jgi:DNA processing protein